MSDPLTASPTELPPNSLNPNSGQPRKAFSQADLEALTESIRRHGILQPIRVGFTSSRWVIIDGHRRWLAAKAAGLDLVPVIVESRELDEAETTLQSLTANIARSDLNPIERGEGIQRVMQLSGKAANVVAREVGISESTTSKLLTILLLSEADKQRVRNGTLGLVAAYRLASGMGKPSAARGAKLGASALVPRVRSSRPKALRVALGSGAVLVLRRAGTAALSTLADTLTDIASRLRAAHAEGVLSPEFLVSAPA